MEQIGQDQTSQAESSAPTATVSARAEIAMLRIPGHSRGTAHQSAPVASGHERDNDRHINGQHAVS
jgi:hypothetical protein